MKRLICAPLLLAIVSLAPSRAVAQGGSVTVADATATPVTKELTGVEIKDVFAAVEDSYRKAGITVTERDPVRYRLSNPALPAQKKIGSMNLEKVFDCGGDRKSPVAASAQLTLNVRTELVKTDYGVEVRSFLAAGGTVMSANGPVAVHCTSLGALERKLEPAPATKAMFPATPTGGKPAYSGRGGGEPR